MRLTGMAPRLFYTAALKAEGGSTHIKEKLCSGLICARAFADLECLCNNKSNTAIMYCFDARCFVCMPIGFLRPSYTLGDDC